MAAVRYTADDFVVAALAIVDEQGIDALTMRSLGDEMRIHGTAIYRHFKGREDLLNAVMDKAAVEIRDHVDLKAPDPRARLLSLMRGVRRGMQDHPNLVATLVNSTGTMPGAFDLTHAFVASLEELGLHPDQLPVALQMLESFMVGATAFDFAGAPDHLEIRRVRRRMLGHAAFDPISRTTDQIHELNEAAFLAGCNALLDACVAMATK